MGFLARSCPREVIKYLHKYMYNIYVIIYAVSFGINPLTAGAAYIRVFIFY